MRFYFCTAVIMLSATAVGSLMSDPEQAMGVWVVGLLVVFSYWVAEILCSSSD